MSNTPGKAVVTISSQTRLRLRWGRRGRIVERFGPLCDPQWRLRPPTVAVADRLFRREPKHHMTARSMNNCVYAYHGEVADMEAAAILKRIRSTSYIIRKELAQLTDVSPSTIGRIERGELGPTWGPCKRSLPRWGIRLLELR